MCPHYECCFYSPLSDTCDYILITGHRRGCPANKDCPHCTSDHIALERKYHKKIRKIDFDMIRRMEEGYKLDLLVKEVSKLANVSDTTYLTWLRKVHPEYWKKRHLGNAY